jgi:hypothetical protein
MIKIQCLPLNYMYMYRENLSVFHISNKSNKELGKLLAHKTSLALPRFIEVIVPSHESEWSCTCVLGVSILSLSTILRLYFKTDLRVCFFSSSILLYMS